MSRVLEIDVGVGDHGFEIEWLRDKIFPSLGITDYRIHGFEACAERHMQATGAVCTDKISIHRVAIADYEGSCRLYYAFNPDGHSIYSTKDNVISKDGYEEVPCTRLSVWMKANVPDFDQFDIRILRFNVEGAEWPLFCDLEQSGLLDSFQIVCGACGGDIKCVRELDGCYEKFLEMIRRHNIDMFWFCWDTINDEKSKETMRQRLAALITGKV